MYLAAQRCKEEATDNSLPIQLPVPKNAKENKDLINAFVEILKLDISTSFGQFALGINDREKEGQHVDDLTKKPITWSNFGQSHSFIKQDTVDNVGLLLAAGGNSTGIWIRMDDKDTANVICQHVCDTTWQTWKASTSSFVETTTKKPISFMIDISYKLTSKSIIKTTSSTTKTTITTKVKTITLFKKTTFLSTTTSSSWASIFSYLN